MSDGPTRVRPKSGHSWNSRLTTQPRRHRTSDVAPAATPNYTFGAVDVVTPNDRSPTVVENQEQRLARGYADPLAYATVEEWIAKDRGPWYPEEIVELSRQWNEAHSHVQRVAGPDALDAGSASLPLPQPDYVENGEPRYLMTAERAKDEHAESPTAGAPPPAMASRGIVETQSNKDVRAYIHQEARTGFRSALRNDPILAGIRGWIFLGTLPFSRENAGDVLGWWDGPEPNSDVAEGAESYTAGALAIGEAFVGAGASKAAGRFRLQPPTALSPGDAPAPYRFDTRGGRPTIVFGENAPTFGYAPNVPPTLELPQLRLPAPRIDARRLPADYFDEAIARLDASGEPFQLHVSERRAQALMAGETNLTDVPGGFHVDEPLPVGDRTIKPQRQVARALDKQNRQLLDPATNSYSKGLRVDPNDIARGREPLAAISLRDDPNAIFTRRFGEVVELGEVFDEAVARINNIGQLSPTQLKARINANIRGIIRDGSTPAGVIVRDMIASHGFEFVPGRGFVVVRPATP